MIQMVSASCYMKKVNIWIHLFHHAEKFFPCCQLQSLICSEFCHTIPRPPDFHENKILRTLDDCTIYLLIVFSVHVKTVRMALLCR